MPSWHEREEMRTRLTLHIQIHIDSTTEQEYEDQKEAMVDFLTDEGFTVAIDSEDPAEEDSDEENENEFDID